MNPTDPAESKLASLVKAEWGGSFEPYYTLVLAIAESAYAMGRLDGLVEGLDEAVQLVLVVEAEQRARVTATDVRGPIWDEGECLAAGMLHLGVYVRGAIRSLAASVRGEEGKP